ncbi:MAG TPA: M1 family metallopeptidase [Candidatus Bathyarchaeia archaeon]|nr:M1 family metallopeptidase [Candidatus Bathyarchaeia archaeon]
MQVKSYDIFLDVDLKNLAFDGKVGISLETDKDVTLNSVDLKILDSKAGGKSVKYEQKGQDLLVKTGPFKGILEITYRGPITSDRLVGLYKAPYDHDYVASTQFEAASARRMVPCVDHPAFKAEFKLTVKTDPGLSVISNMPVKSTSTEGSKKIVEFETTPRMSTYLLYLGVGKFEEIREKSGTVEYIVAATRGKAGSGKFALQTAKETTKYYGSYYGIPYALPKMHLIAVPEFAHGAMENWGAITFRELRLLVGDETSVKIKKRAGETIAHEIAHMWFGDLVTMKWWDDLWLNESFATFMAYKAVDKVYPQWSMWQDFVFMDTAPAMSRDGVENTHPIQVTINSVDDVEEVFDDISYGKGASIIRMIEAHVGQDNFTAGVRSYLQEYKYSNATGNDLWTHIETASKVPVKKIMGDWIRKPGYPAVTVSLVDGKLNLHQERFLLSGETRKDIWPIPIRMKVNGTSHRLILDREQDSVNVPAKLESLKLNTDQTGFYRVFYKGLYDRVSKSDMSTYDRYGIISDAYAFTISGKMGVNEYLELVHHYETEREYLPAYETSDQLGFLYSITPRVMEASKRYHKSQLSLLSERTDENSRELHGIMAERLARVDKDYAKKLGTNFSNYDTIEPDMKQATVVAYARSTGDYDTLLRKYESARFEEDKVRLLVGLTSFEDSSLVGRTLNLAIAGEVKKENVLVMLGLQKSNPGLRENPDAKKATWDWLSANFNWLRQVYQGTGLVSRWLHLAIPFFGQGRVSEVEHYFQKNKPKDVHMGIDVGLEKLRIYDNFVRRIADPEERMVEA